MELKFKTLIDLLDHFADEKVCHEYLAYSRWNGQPTCPHCATNDVTERKARSKKAAALGIPEYRCKEITCGKNFTVMVGTVMEGTKLPLRVWFAAVWLSSTTSKGISSLNMAKQLGITQKSSWFVLSRIREMYEQSNNEPLTGIVEVDEKYVGGKVTNMHEKQATAAKNKLNSGKTVVMGFVERGGEIRTQIITAATLDQMQPAVLANVDTSAELMTDSHQSYKTLHKIYDNHTLIKTEPNNYKTTGKNHTNTIEGAWSLFQRMIDGTYHQISRKHTNLYCNEFVYRYNQRTMGLNMRFANAVAMVGKKRITYAALIADKS